MKTSIAVINSSINLKVNNGIMGYNFYEWLKQAQKDFRSDLTLTQLWLKISYAACTESSCKNKFSTSKRIS